jgi:hypothetical protein
MLFYAGYRERLIFEGIVYVFSGGALWFIQVLAGRRVHMPGIGRPVTYSCQQNS